MPIWTNMLTIGQANKSLSNTLAETLGIRIAHIGDDFIVGTMNIDKKLSQPSGSLHGGASAVLAETLSDLAANCCINTELYQCRSLDINLNHISPIYSGSVTAMARPINIGETHHVWRIEIKDENDMPICEARATLAVVKAG
ncbi:MAG: 1,4-dihydroxy-2-naphthoyl-CoA hydrolase [Candidatus Azotimanducaceae bacterium]|jgi:1,4-dihydroxy-2-naphthoyl-CoA hydrolase